MRIRQFTAATTTEALRALREALGEDALVLSTRHEPTGVIITAADDVADGDETDAAAARIPIALTAGDVDPSADVRFDLALIRTQLEQLGRRMQRMDRVLLDVSGDAFGLGPDGREIVDRLVASGFGRHLAQPVARSFERAVAGQLPREDALCASLLEHVAVAPADGPRVEAFVGPTGSGKTTTIAKLAARRVRVGLPAPVLIVADTQRIGAVDELGAYARLLGAPLHVALDGDELAAVLAQCTDADKILIDTGGLCGDALASAEVRTLLAGAGDALVVTAVISAAASLRSLQRVWPQLAQLGAARCVVTRLDEGDEPGVACTWLAETGLPLAWLGTGRRIPDDLIAASGDEIVRRLMAA
jgi:flagellar biosynthesis protein FlhF